MKEKIEQARELLGDSYVIVPIANWNHDVEDYKILKSELEIKDTLLQNSRTAMIAALKHIDGTAKLFSHRTQSVVLYQLSEALKPLNYPLPEDTMKAWEQMMEEAQNATYVDCRVLKRMGMFDPHQVGDIIGVEEKGVQEFIDIGYVEVVG